jgi:GDSL-like Lipase/Acylhydrolase
MGELASRQIPQATKITFYVILVVIIPMIGILGPELAVRILFPKINYVGESSSLLQDGKFGDSPGYRANATGYSWGVSLTTDEFGFRHDPQQKPQPKTVPAIVILGDSVPNGIGVEASVTFSTLLANRLQKRIINTSVTGQGIKDYENVVRYFVIPKRAELNIERAVLFVTLNDVDPDQSGAEAIQRYHKPFMVRLAERLNEAFNFNTWLIQRSKLYLLLKGISYDSSKAWFLGDLDRFRSLDDLKGFSKRLRAIKAALDAAGIPLLVVIVPYEYQLRQPTTENLFPQEMLGKILTEGGFKFLDMRSQFQEAQKQKSLRSSDFFLFNDHAHLSAAGHALVAEALAGRL